MLYSSIGFIGLFYIHFCTEQCTYDEQFLTTGFSLIFVCFAYYSSLGHYVCVKVSLKILSLDCMWFSLSVQSIVWKDVSSIYSASSETLNLAHLLIRENRLTNWYTNAYVM